MSTSRTPAESIVRRRRESAEIPQGTDYSAVLKRLEALEKRVAELEKLPDIDEEALRRHIEEIGGDVDAVRDSAAGAKLVKVVTDVPGDAREFQVHVHRNGRIAIEQFEGMKSPIEVFRLVEGK